MARVPDVSGLHLAEAFNAIREEGLQPVLIGLPTMKTTGNKGYVVAAQEPAAGHEVREGTRVALAAVTHLLSFGTLDGPPVAAPGMPAPDLVGVEVERAMHQVTGAGFVAVVVQPERGVEEPTVSRQEPEPGQPVGPFREVVLRLD